MSSTTVNFIPPSSPPETHKAWTQVSSVPREDQTKVPSIEKALTFNQATSTPKLAKSQQVLIKVVRCTLNPNDLLHLGGTYSVSQHIPMPRPMGFEGSGVVVESTASWIMGLKKGTRVAFYCGDGGGFGEYVVCDASAVVPITDDVSFERAACSMANPLSSIVMVDEAKGLGHKTILNTAAAGALGQCLYRYATKQGMDVICIVRKQSQVDFLKKELGAKYVLNSNTPTFEKDLSVMMKETNCTFCYDCLAGDMPNLLLKTSPLPNTIVKVYGNMVSDDMTIDINSLSDGRKVDIFLVGESMSKMWIWTLLNIISKVKAWMSVVDEGIQVAKTYKLAEVPNALADYGGDNKTAGKVQVDCM